MDLQTAPLSLLIKRINEDIKRCIDREVAGEDMTRDQGHLLMTLYRSGEDLTMKAL